MFSDSRSNMVGFRGARRGWLSGTVTRAVRRTGAGGGGAASGTSAGSTTLVGALSRRGRGPPDGGDAGAVAGGDAGTAAGTAAIKGFSGVARGDGGDACGP